MQGRLSQIVNHAAWKPSLRQLSLASRRRHTRFDCDWSSDVCSSDLTAEPSLVDPRELRDDVVERGRRDAAAREVDPPTVEASRVGVTVPGLLDRGGAHEVESPVAGDVEDDGVTVFVRIHRVENVRRIGVEPADVRVASAPWHDAEARATLRLPRERA